MRDRREALDVFAGQHAARRVVRRIQVEHARLRRDRLFDFVDVPAEAQVFAQRHLHRLAARGLDHRHGRRPFRIGNDHFVAGLEQRVEHRVEAVRAAVGDENLLVRFDRDVVLVPHLLRECLAQRRNAGGREVVRAVVGHRFRDGLLEGLGRVEGDVALIEAERILDGVHHVADANDGGDGN